MSQPPQQPATPSGAYGAIDLTAVAGDASSPAASGGIRDAIVQQVTEATFSEAVNSTVRVPAVLVIYSSRAAETRRALDVVTDAAVATQGRLRVFAVDADTNPGLVGALQIQAVPVTMGLIQGQPVPLFQGVPAPDQVDSVMAELLRAAVQSGVTGRVDLGEVESSESANPLIEQAYAALAAGNFDEAVAAYEQALAANPKDEEARLGLAQVQLLRRTADVDIAATREAAAANPQDVDLAIAVADLDIVGGHVEDAFNRLLDVIRTSDGPDQARAKAHLLELLDVVGNADPRVKKARTALMSALF